jgi:protein gp37
MGNPKYQNDGDDATSGPGFRLTLHPDQLALPRRWKTSRVIFVNSMSDLFHKDVPLGFIRDVFDVMAETSRHTYQLLTKRSKRLAQVADRLHWPENLWMGVTVESDRYAFRADHLRDVDAAVRFLSVEPLLGPVPSLNLDGLHWVIAGGESGHGARPMHPAWVRTVRDQCEHAGVPFFFKQWGAWTPAESAPTQVGFDGSVSDAAENYAAVPGAPVRMRKMGKSKAGRTLDGRTWDEYPL